MNQHSLQALSGTGGSSGAAASQDAERDHLDCVELGKIEMFTERRVITPAYAAMVLEKFAPPGTNRGFRVNNLRDLINTIREGRWDRHTHQGIAFRADGVLADGQHRLQACVTAGLPIELPVTYGLPEQTFRIIDQGTPRSAADLVTVAPGRAIAQAHNAAATARLVLLLTGQKNGNSLTKNDTLNFVLANTDEIGVCVRIGGNTATGIGGVISKSQLSAAAFIIRASCHDHEAVDTFFDRLKDGANLAKKSPLLTLRDALKDGKILQSLKDGKLQVDNPQGEKRGRRLAGSVINAWNLWRGKARTAEVKDLVVRDDKFPVPRS